MHGQIKSTQVWPATRGAAPVFVPVSQPNLGVVRGSLVAQGSVKARARFPIAQGAAPILTELEEPTVQELSKWSPVYPDYISRHEHHAAYTRAEQIRNYLEVFDPRRFHPVLPTLPIWPQFDPAGLGIGGLRVPLRVTIDPAMWMGYQPSLVYGPQTPIYVGASAPDRLPDFEFRVAWRGTYPEFVRTFGPIHHLVPAWFGPDTTRPNQPDEVEDRFVWFQQQPDFARGLPPLAHLSPAVEWDISFEIHGRDPTIIISSRHYFVHTSRIKRRGRR